MDFADLPADELVRHCASGTEAAWVELLRRFQPLVAGTAVRVVARRSSPAKELIDDLVQQTFLRLCEKDRRVLREFRPFDGAGFPALLKVITTNVCYDHLRRRKSTGGDDMVPLDPLVELLGFDGAGSMERGVLLSEIDRLMETDTPPVVLRDRNMFRMHFRQGISFVEIARMESLELSAAGVETAVRRVVLRLRDLMNKPNKRGPE